MKKVGIIGGAGPLASSLLYESVVHECYVQGGDIPEILLLNFPFTRCLTKDEASDNLSCVLEELSYCINTLERHEVEVGLLACNTMHLFLKMLPKPLLQFHALPELVLCEARKKKACSLFILGSQNSCRLGLYEDPEITMAYPSHEEQRVVDNVIDRVLQGKISPEDSQSISRLILNASERIPFDGVVLGCTDLPVLHHHYPIKSMFPIYDSIKIASKKLRGLL